MKTLPVVFLGLIFVFNCFGMQSLSEGPTSTLSDFLGSSDKSDYEITEQTLAGALIEMNGELKVSSFEPVKMMKDIWADPDENDFPVEDISHEYILFRLGATALYSFSHFVEGFWGAQELSSILRSHAPNSSPILYFIQPKSRAEMDCMHASWTTTSCEDPFRGGLQDSEVVCSDGKNYLKCHVQCHNSVGGGNLSYENGPCLI